MHSEWSNWNGKSLGGRDKAVIIACQFYCLAAPHQKGDRSEMQGVKCVHRTSPQSHDGGARSSAKSCAKATEVSR